MNAIAEAILLAGFASVLLIAVMLMTGRTGALDQPNHRSLHERPVPRSGGMGILAALLVGYAYVPGFSWLAGPVLCLAVVSWLDDQFALPVVIRFTAHIAAAAMALYGLLPGLPPLVLLAAVVAVVWMTNLYNFMDGANGLAGGMGLFGFLTFAISANQSGHADLAVLCACVAAGSAGFLIFNFNPARIFLGDVGSIPLGFLAGTLGLVGVARDIWPLWLPILAFSPFIADATVTLLRRALRGERIWLPHREHFYQRLVLMGWSHRRVALAAYALMAAAGGSALALRGVSLPLQWGAVAVWAVIYLVLMIRIDRLWTRFAGQEVVQ